MSLNKQEVIKKAKKYFATGEKYGFMTEALQNFLGAEFIAAPASTRTDLHNCFEGGLLDHILRTTSYAVKLNEILPESQRVDVGSLVKVCCLAQIGKAKLYIAQTSQWHIDRGMLYDFNNNLMPMRVGERSVLYAISNGVTLSEDEYQAILNHDKDDSDKQAKYHSCTLAVLLRQAIELAVLEEKSK